MYRKIETLPTPIEKFELPFEGQLAEDNRWVIMANLIPWSKFEDEYAKQFTIEMGAPAKSFRTAIGALIIKEKLGILYEELDENENKKPRTYRNTASCYEGYVFLDRISWDNFNESGDLKALFSCV
jgi:hypothetical protein